MVLFQMKDLHSWVNPFKTETKLYYKHWLHLDWGPHGPDAPRP